jgi:paraquat-inducible protein A
VNATLVECHDCGLRLHLAPLVRGVSARCPRCAARLRAVGSRDIALAMALTGLVLIFLANFMPFLSFGMEGQIDEASLATGAVVLYGQGLWPLTCLILFVTIIAPTVKLGAISYVLTSIERRHPPRHLVPILRWVDELHPWSMIEVYLLGLFVAYVRLAGEASVTVGVAVYALGALVFVMATVDHFIDYDELWEEIERKGVAIVPPPPEGAPLVACHVCGLVAEDLGHRARCPRCRARLHHRKPESVARCWALVITAAILYLPANLYPIITVVSFGTGSPDTILSGVEHLYEIGSWPLALLVFFASITVPVLKIVGLVLLLTATHWRWRWHLLDRTRLYRVIESIGRWSMIDIFMLSILVALVRLGAIATVFPGVGAIAFAAVVVITMFAAMSFDPRLMWDAAGENR